MIIELHILQNFAPSNLNRDDTNSPKECEFGGYRRARISSQCIKRAIRQEPIFQHILAQELAKRTKLIAPRLKGTLPQDKQNAPESDAIVKGIIANLSTFDGSSDKTKVLLFIGEDEIQWMRDIILKEWDNLVDAHRRDSAEKDEKKRTALAAKCKEAMKGFERTTSRSPDIALFGRMLAENPGYNIDAACQVAHAISTHKVGVEFDFYTAVDDLQPKEQTGASMMGTVEFNSACYYRYANIDVNQLKDNLLGKPREKATADELKEASALAGKTVDAFIRAAVNAIPTGKQNSFAAQNPPSFIFAVARDSGTWSLANAFASPVWVGDNGDLVKKSQDALIDYWGNLVKVYGEKSIKAKPAVTLNASQLSGLGSVENLDKLIARINQAVEVDS